VGADKDLIERFWAIGFETAKHLSDPRAKIEAE
jgi:hypothetical protein